MSGLIFTENLKKTYILGDIEVNALRGINLTVLEGDYLSIMGSSGSGKSTLMNILGCLDTPSEGKYLFKDNDISNLTQDEMSDIRNKEIGFDGVTLLCY